MQAPLAAPTDEPESYLCDEDDLSDARPEVMFLCAACDGIAGYYPRRYEVVPCPHCEGDAYFYEAWFQH